MPKRTELTLTFRRERQVFLNGSDDPNSPDCRRVVIGECVNEKSNAVNPLGPVTIKGEAREKQLQPGMTYRFFGRWTTHHKYGKQFHFDNFITEQPATEEGIVAYLSQLSGDKIGVKVGIGRGKAYLLWEAFGPKAVETLRTDPQRVAKEVKGLSKATCQAASEYLVQFQAIEKCKIDLIGLLDGRGFPRKTVDLAIEKYGSKAAEAIRHNPYLLMNFRGCGFLGTDKMYLDLGGNPQRLKRQALCCWYAVASDTNGHTWHPYGQAELHVRKNVAGAAVDPERAVLLALRAGLLAEYIDENGVRWIAEARKAANEERLAEYVRGAMEESK